MHCRFFCNDCNRLALNHQTEFVQIEFVMNEIFNCFWMLSSFQNSTDDIFRNQFHNTNDLMTSIRKTERKSQQITAFMWQQSTIHRGKQHFNWNWKKKNNDSITINRLLQAMEDQRVFRFDTPFFNFIANWVLNWPMWLCCDFVKCKIKQSFNSLVLRCTFRIQCIHHKWALITN